MRERLPRSSRARRAGWDAETRLVGVRALGPVLEAPRPVSREGGCRRPLLPPSTGALFCPCLPCSERWPLQQILAQPWDSVAASRNSACPFLQDRLLRRPPLLGDLEGALSCQTNPLGLKERVSHGERRVKVESPIFTVSWRSQAATQSGSRFFWKDFDGHGSSLGYYSFTFFFFYNSILRYPRGVFSVTFGIQAA